MTYTINGKPYTEFDINKRCAEIDPYVYKIHGAYPAISESAVHTEGQHGKYGNYYEVGFDPCNNPADTWPIIEKCWDELMADFNGELEWCYLIDKYNCTKLVAACICLIELNDND